MPLYRFVCPEGHERELLRSMDVELEWCPCGKSAARQAVNQVAIGHKFIGDFRDHWKHNSSIRAAHQEAVGYAAELRQVAAEETANGFKPGRK